MTTSQRAERDALMSYVGLAMMTLPPDYLTIEELRAIKTVIRGAIERASRPIANVINLADRRRARVMPGKLGLTRKTTSCAAAGVVTPFPTCDNVVTPPDC